MSLRVPMHILTINSGSSSLKFSLYNMQRDAQIVLLEGFIERIGFKDSCFQVKDSLGNISVQEQCALPDHNAALDLFLKWWKKQDSISRLDAVGHRIVQGGKNYTIPQKISPALLKELKNFIPLAPDHLPQALNAIEAILKVYPNLPQIVCFDTAFHRHMPVHAQTYPLPRHITESGVIRYGFHGISYESIMEQLRKTSDERTAQGRVVIAHLGNGASMTAVHRGISIDTTMGFTPSGGLMMSTRCGDMDPSVIVYLLMQSGMDLNSIKTMINDQSGLLGVSGISSDMHDLLQKEKNSPEASEAINLFCYQAKKFLGALVAALGGLDTLIFTGGIGEHSAPIRERICANMDYLGISLDHSQNKTNAPIISKGESSVIVRVMKTDEALILAKHTKSLITDLEQVKR